MLEKIDLSLECPCPSMNVVLGHVGDIGEVAQAIIPFERVSTTMYPNRHGIPKALMEEVHDDARKRGKQSDT